ncbi:uncharacterized protein LOC144468796 [Augochlora pura]
MNTSISKENRSDDIQLMRHICDNIELKVHKNILESNYEILQQKRAILKEERMKMNNVNCTVWAIEDSFCNEVWNFSQEHKFGIIFKQYPAITELIESHNCKYSTVPYNYEKGVDKIKEDKVIELKNEIDNINNQITFIRNKNIEQDITNATAVLDNLKSFSEDILHLIRLVNFADNSQNICNTFKCKKLRTDKGFKNAGNYLKNRPVTIIGENIAPSLNNSTKISKNEKRPCMKNNMQFGKFILKKQSIISLKLNHEKNRISE